MILSNSEYIQYVRNAIDEIISKESHGPYQAFKKMSETAILNYIKIKFEFLKNFMKKNVKNLLAIPNDLDIINFIPALDQSLQNIAKLKCRLIMFEIIKLKLLDIFDFNELYKYFCILKILLLIIFELEKTDIPYDTLLYILYTNSYENIKKKLNHYSTPELIDLLQNLKLEMEKLPVSLNPYDCFILKYPRFAQILQSHPECSKLVVYCHGAYEGKTYELRKRHDDESIHVILPNSIGHLLYDEKSEESRICMRNLCQLLKSNNCFKSNGEYTQIFKQWISSTQKIYSSNRQQSTESKPITFTDHTTKKSLIMNDLQLYIKSDRDDPLDHGIYLISPYNIYNYNVKQNMDNVECTLSELVYFCLQYTNITTFFIFSCRSVSIQMEARDIVESRGRTISLQGRVSMAKQGQFDETSHQARYRIDNELLLSQNKSLREDITSLISYRKENEDLHVEIKDLKDHISCLKEELSKLKSKPPPRRRLGI
jgi:hypothetical protein